MKFYERSLQALLSFAPSRLRRSLVRSRETRFTRRNRRACSQAISLLSVTTFRNLQQPDILQEVLNMGGKTRNRCSTHFAAVLQNKLHVFIATIRVNV